MTLRTDYSIQGTPLDGAVSFWFRELHVLVPARELGDKPYYVDIDTGAGPDIRMEAWKEGDEYWANFGERDGDADVWITRRAHDDQ